MLLDGGAGWLVSEIVPASNRIGVLGTAGLGSQGTQMMLVDAGGRAVVFTVSGMSTSGGTTNVTASGSGCFAGLQASAGDGNKNALLFRVKTLGLRYDGSDVLYQREGSGPELPLAFNLSDVGISYVYEGESGTLYTLNAPKLENGNPARNSVHNGEAVELRRLQIALAGEGRGLSSTVERRYVSQVEMASNPSFFIKVVTTCS